MSIRHRHEAVALPPLLAARFAAADGNEGAPQSEAHTLERSVGFD